MSSTKVSSIRSRYEQNSTSNHQADLVRLTSSGKFPRRASSAAPTKVSGSDSLSTTLHFDADFSCSNNTNDTFYSMAGSSLSERLRSAWYMIDDEDDDSDDE